MIRCGVFLALALSLSACGVRDDRDPFTDSRIPPSLGPAYWPPQGWAWGLIQVGQGPAQRYGVAAPPDQPPLAQALMLPGYGGLSEEDFAGANAFIDRRIQVWTLDGVGQGGSGRLASPRDLGHLDGFDGDVLGLQQLVPGVVRSGTDAPLVVIADGTAALVLLRALQLGLPGVAAGVLTEPRVSPSSRGPVPPSPAWARWLGLSRRRSPGGRAWRREVEAPQGSLAYVRHAWQLANPDLRMGGPSLGWQVAFDRLSAETRAAGWRSLRVPLLVLADPSAPRAQRTQASRLCAALPRCTLLFAGEARWPDLEADFIAGVLQARANPLESAALPIPRRER